MRNFMCLAFMIAISFNCNAKERIAIIDTGLKKGFYNPKYLCKKGHYGNYKESESTHGTNVYNLLTHDLDSSRFCIVYIKIEINTLGGFYMENYVKALDKLTNVDYVNLSFSGEPFLKKEYFKLKALLDKGVFIFVAAGNDGVDMDKNPRYPAAYPFNHENFIVIGNTVKSNRGSMVDFVVNGVNKGIHFKLTGTSQSTPIALNYFLTRSVN